MVANPEDISIVPKQVCPIPEDGRPQTVKVAPISVDSAPPLRQVLS